MTVLGSRSAVAKGTRRLYTAPTKDELQMARHLTDLLGEGLEEAAAAELDGYCIRKESEALDDLSPWDLVGALDDDMIEHLLVSQPNSILMRLMVRRAWESFLRRVRSITDRRGCSIPSRD